MNTPRTDPQYVEVEVGDVLCHPGGGSWAKGAAEAIVLFTSATCGVCNANRPFEDAFIGAARTRGIALDVVISKGRAHDKLAKRLRERGLDVIRVTGGALGVSKVPSFLVVGAEGRVLSRWVGSVPLERRAAFLGDLLGRVPLQHYDRIGRKAFELTLRQSEPAQLLALHRAPPRYTEIPLAQLMIRADYELDRGRTVFVDCATAASAFECQSAAFELAVMGFRHVVAVDLAHRRAGCADRENPVTRLLF